MAKVYYLEDETFLAQIVVETLETKGFEVKHDSIGSVALASIKEFQPDICVLDIMVPGKSGLDVAEKLNAIHPNLPIIFLTAKNQTADIVSGFKSGGNDYLTKPFSMEELMVRINNLLMLSSVRLARKPKTEVFRIGDICSFNPLALKIEIKNEEVKLSHKENEILKLLITHQNQTITKEEILMKVWKDDSYFNSRNLDVYMRKIRKIFAACPEIHLETLRGVGYIFQVNLS